MLTRFLFLSALALMIVSCSQDELDVTDGVQDTSETSEIELSDDRQNTTTEVDFTTSSLLSNLEDGTPFTFPSTSLVSEIAGKNFEFTNKAEQEEIDLTEYVAQNGNTSISVQILDKEYFWMSIYTNKKKYVITNNSEDNKTIGYKDQNFQPLSSDLNLRAQYTVDIFVYADKAYRDSPTPWAARSGIFYLMDQYRDATNVLSSQLPISFNRMLVWSPVQPWSSSSSVSSARTTFKNAINTTDLVWLPRSVSKMRRMDIHIGITGYNLPGGTIAWGTAGIQGSCGHYNDAVLVEGSPSRHNNTYRNLAAAIGNSLGGKLNTSQPNMLNWRSSGTDREIILQSTKDQILDNLSSGSCF